MMTIVNSVMQTKVDLIREGQILHLSEETPVLYWMHTKFEWDRLIALKAELQKPAGAFWKPAKVDSAESIHRAFRFKQIYQENGIDWPLELTPFAMIWSADEKSCKDFFFRKSRVIRKGTINSGLDNRHKMRPAKLGLCPPPREALTCKLLRDTE